MSLDLADLVFLFSCTAEAVANRPVEDLERALKAVKGVAKRPTSQEEVKFVEPLIIEFLEKALEKRRMME